jgi:predicted enzyme related to lactoylglutathione lyase
MTMTFAPGQPAWVDLGTSDVPAASAFYTGVFGWTIDDLGPEAGGYGILRKDGQQIGGIGPATDDSRGTSWSIYFSTDDANDTESRVATGGGTVIMPPMDVMDQGRMAVFQDPVGAYFSVWQAGKLTGMDVIRVPGTVSWVELYSTDLESVTGFYATVLGVGVREIPGMGYTLFEVDGESVAGAMASPEATSRWQVYFEVEDADAVADRALELGAEELLRQDSPAGRLASLVDPQGGVFCIIRSDPDFTP